MIVKHLMSHARLAAASLALLTAHIGPASAFTVDLSALTDAAEPGTHYIPTLSFALDAPLVPYRAEVSLTPALPRKLGMFSLMAEETYNAEQATQFPDWTFTLKDQSQLGGTLAVDRYQARRGRIASEGVGNAAGASLHMTYTRAATDPANLTWLQVYRENTDGGGPDAWHVDPFPNDDGGEKLPFYFRKRAAVAWCDKINILAPEQRSNAEWYYALLGEDVFYEWRDKGASMRDMLDYAKLRPVDERVQATFTF